MIQQTSVSSRSIGRPRLPKSHDLASPSRHSRPLVSNQRRSRCTADTLCSLLSVRGAHQEKEGGRAGADEGAKRESGGPHNDRSFCPSGLQVPTRVRCRGWAPRQLARFARYRGREGEYIYGNRSIDISHIRLCDQIPSLSSPLLISFIFKREKEKKIGFELSFTSHTLSLSLSLSLQIQTDQTHCFLHITTTSKP